MSHDSVAGIMIDQSRPVRLTNSDLAYLRQHAILADKLAEDTVMPDPETQSVMIGRELAEAIRGELTVRLARVGFDDKYELTGEGRFLEDLIDRLFSL
jgi:hypothetical protein